MITSSQKATFLAGDTFHEVYTGIIASLLNNGQMVGKTKECLFLSFLLIRPNFNKINVKKNWAWAYAELFDRLTGNNPGTAFHLRPKWAVKLEKEGGTFDYSYGGIYKEQLPKLISAIKRKYDREAIIAVWGSEHIDRDIYRRRPCTLTIQFYNRADKLHCFVNMRSSDVINLLPYDVFHHTSLQMYIASILGLELGNYYHTVAQYYWPKKRELRGFGNKLFKELQETTSPLGYPFPWIQPEKSISTAHACIRLTLANGTTDFEELNSIPDSSIQTMTQHVIEVINARSKKSKCSQTSQTT